MNGRELFFRTCIIIGAIFCAYLVYQLADTILVLFIAIIIASAMRPLVERLVRFKVPRSLSILLIYLLVFGGAIGLAILTIPPMIDLLIQLTAGDFIAEQTRELLREVASFAWQQFRIFIPVGRLPEQTQDFLSQFEDLAYEQAWPFARTLSTVIGQFLLVVVMCFYWLTSREKILDLSLRVSAAHHRNRLKTIWTDIEETLGSYVRGQVILSLIVGSASYVGLLLLGIPNALALAVIAALFEFIPYVGPFLGALPSILIGLTVSPLIGISVAGWYLLVQQVESNVLIPRIMQQSVGLNPLLVIIAIVGGGSLNGITGAILAIPIVGALQVIMRHMWIEPAINKEQTKEDGGVLLAVDNIETQEEKIKVKIERINEY